MVVLVVLQRGLTCVLMELVFLWNYEEFSGIDEIFLEKFVDSALGKLEFKSFIVSNDLGGRPRHNSIRIFWFWRFLEFSGIFRNFQSQDTVADFNTGNF